MRKFLLILIFLTGIITAKDVVVNIDGNNSSENFSFSENFLDLNSLKLNIKNSKFNEVWINGANCNASSCLINKVNNINIDINNVKAKRILIKASEQSLTASNNNIILNKVTTEKYGVYNNIGIVNGLYIPPQDEISSSNNNLEIQDSTLYDLSSIGNIAPLEKLQNNNIIIKNSNLYAITDIDLNIGFIDIQYRAHNQGYFRKNKLSIINSNIEGATNIFISNTGDGVTGNGIYSEYSDNKITFQNSKINFANGGKIGIEAQEDVNLARDGGSRNDFKNNEIRIIDSQLLNLTQTKIHGEKNFDEETDFGGGDKRYIKNNKIFIANSGTSKLGNTRVDGKLITPLLETSGENIEVGDINDVLEFAFHLTTSNKVEKNAETYYKADGKNPVLIANTQADLANSKVSLHFHGDQNFGENPKINLIKNVSNKPKQGNTKIKSGLTQAYNQNDFEDGLEGNIYYIKLKSNTQAPQIEDKKGTILLLPQLSLLSNALKSNDTIANKISTIARNLDTNQTISTFAYANTYKTKYKNFSDDFSAQFYTAGVSSTNDGITGGIFTQYSNGKANDKIGENYFNNKTKLYDVGLLARVDLANFYIDSFAKIGQIQNKNNFNLEGNKISFKSKQTFYSGGVYIGNNKQISQNITFDNKFGYSYTKVGSYEIKDKGDKAKLDKISSNLAEISNTLSFDFDKILAFIGAKFEYEFSTKSKFYENGDSYEKSFKGFSYGGRVGFGLNIAKNSLISLEGSLIKGKRKEKSAQIGFVYKF